MNEEELAELLYELEQQGDYEAMEYLLNEYDAGAPMQAPQAAPETGEPGQHGTFLDPVLKGATANYSDELMGHIGAVYSKAYDMVAKSPVGDFLDITPTNLSYDEAYEQTRDIARRDIEQFEERNPTAALAGELGGGALTMGYGGAKLMAPLANAPKWAKAAGFTGIAAGEGALYGAGEGETTEERLDNAKKGAILSAVATPIINKAGTVVGEKLIAPAARKIAESEAPRRTIEEVRNLGTELYERAKNLGVVIKPETYDKFVDQMMDTLRSRGYGGRSYPQLNTFMKELADNKGKTISYGELANIRRTLDAPSMSDDPAVRSLAGMADDEITALVQNMRSMDVVQGNPAELNRTITEAKELWSRQARAETLDEIHQSARRSREYREGDIDDAIADKLKGVLDSRKNSRGFTDIDKQTMDDIILGDRGKKTARFFRKFSPAASTQRGSAGPFLGMASLIGSGTAFSTGNIPMALAMLAPPVVGGIGHRAANRRTLKEFNTLVDDILNTPDPYANILDQMIGKYKPGIAGVSANIAAQIPNIHEKLQNQ